MELLKGKTAADKINERTAVMAQELLSKDIVPTLAILRVGSNPSDIAYEENAVKKAKRISVGKYEPDATRRYEYARRILMPLIMSL